MGRLFWKILIGSWLMLLFSGLATGTAVWFYQNKLHNASPERDFIHPATFDAIRSASSTLKYGGVSALKNMLEEQQQYSRLKVFALDEKGNELLGRTVSTEEKERALKRAEKKVESSVVRENYSPEKKYKYVLFVPNIKNGLSKRIDDLPKGKRPPPRPGPPWFPIIMMIFATFLFSTLLALYLSKPINFLKRGFNAFSEGRRISVASLMGGRRDELADLGKEFDSMADHLAALMESQRNLLHDVSHELRSPLARLQVRIGLLRQKPENIQTSLDDIEREIQRLDQLVGEVLTLSRLEADSKSFESQYADEYIDILELMDSIIDDARFEAESSSRKLLFITDIESELIIKGNGELLYRAIENIIRNAIHHTPENTTVSVSVFKATPSQIQIIVEDQGEGISDELLKHLFEPFSRGNNSSGYGLGLAIARRAVEAHNGTITASNNKPHGLRVVVTLKLGRLNLDS